MAIGLKGLTSVYYINQVDSSIVVNETVHLEIAINNLINNEETIRHSNSIREYVIKQQDIGKVREGF